MRALAVQLLPPPRPALDPAERLGIDLSSAQTADDLRQIVGTLLAAISRGEIGPAEGARIARRGRARLRAVRRLKRLARRLPHKTAPARTPIG